ncbi:uncharacterized protein C2orf81 homolog isoform X1 [Carcharodon carcharias]|uniref:uncharacterized protein C2orf81 homolog isoform X1 n=1 Tax=Carcharodon carcharias TaxID=13397 RepID=UPI001B7DE415|nr:uncharacterized protein C2orf81 homolog isoform X1 [Carcharodon carcharias]XP_041058502.1 uncharacterized protein C2orf81 homolog isoform X1 [Carcharodon carcharias]XP_041058582.1 uncharacterized protein C2orf81 homolog isoform X1 [Carcharodon carcharias]
MSRSAVQKSRLEKSRTLSAAVSTPQAAVVEIVPGRFTENDWHSMVTNEDNEIHVGDIIDDIVNRVLDGCSRVYIEKQLLPFTIAQAKDAILQIIEWQLLTYDSGERNIIMEPSWQEDKEPVAFITDSWAQGSVPVVRNLSTSTLEKQETFEEAPGDIICLVREDTSQTVITAAGHSARPECWSGQEGHQGVQDMFPLCKELMGYHLDSEKEAEEANEAEEPDEPQRPPTVKKKEQKFKPHRGPLRSAKLKNINKSLDKMEKELFQQQASEPCIEEPPAPPCEVYRMTSYFQNVLKIQNSRLPLNNNMTFDEFGNVTSVQRLKPSQFPRQQVRPVFQLLDVDLEPETHRPLLRESLRPLVFRSGNFGKSFIPARYNVRMPRKQVPGNSKGLQTLERAVLGKPDLHGSNAVRPNRRPAPARQLKLNDSCAVSTTPEFIPDGTKDRNHSNCGQYPEYEEEQPSRLRPICNSLFRPPILVEKLTSGIVQ